MTTMYCPRCRTRYKDPPDVCRYCEIPLVEQLPSRTLTDYREDAAETNSKEYSFDIPDEEPEGPQDLAALREAAKDQKERVRLLNRYLLLRVFWFAAWLTAGFFTAYLLAPDDATEGMKLLINAAFIAAALILANLILRMRVRQNDLPGTNDTP